jgi:O-antigen ligase
MTLDVWRIHMFIGMVFVSLFFPLLFKDKIHKSFIALWIYGLMSAVWIGFFPMTYKREFVTLELSTMAKQGALQSFVMMAIVPAVLLNAGKNLARYLSWISVLNLGLVLVFNFGIFNVNTMDVTAMAIGSIYLASQEDKTFFDKLMAVIGAFGIGYIKGSTGLICLFAGLIYLMSRKFSKKYIILGSVSGFISLYFVLKYLNIKSFEYRIEGWKAVMGWWKGHAPVWFGMGPGSFEWLAPFIKIPTGEVYLWMHNDYLQFLFEYGYLGMILALLVLCVAVYKSFSMYLFPAVMVSLLAMAGYFPGHFFLSQCLMMLILFESLKPKAINRSIGVESLNN